MEAEAMREIRIDKHLNCRGVPFTSITTYYLLRYSVKARRSEPRLKTSPCTYLADRGLTGCWRCSTTKRSRPLDFEPSACCVWKLCIAQPILLAGILIRLNPRDQ